MIRTNKSKFKAKDDETYGEIMDKERHFKTC